ncbi:unnamed protein product, partial [marine sediment metagenome]
HTVYIWPIAQGRRTIVAPGKFKEGTGVAYSILVIGKSAGGNTYQYWRKETTAPGAGQTLLYKNGASPQKATLVLRKGNVWT